MLCRTVCLLMLNDRKTESTCVEQGQRRVDCGEASRVAGYRLHVVDMWWGV